MSDSSAPQSFTQFSYHCLRRDSERITRAWVERLSSQIGVRPRAVLPHQELLDHVPEVLDRAAEFLIAPDTTTITSQKMVTEEMRKIARLRRKQGFDAQEIIREFDELAAVLDGAALHWLDEYQGIPDPKEVGIVFGRLNRAPLLMGEVTVGTYQEEEQESRYTAARQLGEFAETLMHQLKTPLGAAEGAALLLENEETTVDPDERRRFAALIRRNLSRARVVVDDVRALSLAQLAVVRAGRWLPLAQVLGEVLMEIRPLVQTAGVRIDVEEPLPAFPVDASRVELVLLNLLSNAAKYADPGKSRRWVKVCFKEEEAAWWLEVQDNGLGIEPELHGRIFDRFFRAHPEIGEGTGLGLAIVKEAVQQLGSRLEFDSIPGEGTTFRFLLPTPATVDPDAAEQG